MNINDIVFPAYDGKLGRCTRCQVVDVKDEVVYVKGIYWGHDTEEIGEFRKIDDGEVVDYYCAWVGDEDELMVLLGISERGDYYHLYTLEEMKGWVSFFSEDYIKELGLN